ncbi:MAG: hypothetical protein AB9833_05625 [Bacteroidales bacterium]
MTIIDLIIEYWWQLLITLLAAIPSIILFTAKGRITHWFNKDLETHKSELDKKSKQIQSSLDTQLETLRIQFSIINTERLQILKEGCVRITETLNQINTISSYYEYDCKENVDFESNCLSDGTKCDNSCILNYWEKIITFDKYTRDTDDFFKNNQMFFPLEVVSKHLKIIVLVFNLRKDVYDAHFQQNISSKEKALKCFELFHNFDREEIRSLSDDLINEYRVLIGVPPLKNFSIDEYKLFQKIQDMKNLNN